MGVGVSSMMGMGVDTGWWSTGLGDLPEGCVAEVLALLDVQEICRLGKLSRVFRAAAAADLVWEKKLPGNYGYLIERVLGERDLRGGLSKREIYARLSRPNRFDGGAKELWLEKNSGSVCLLISSKAFSITGIDDRRYWNYIPTEESRFQKVAYLQQIWWFEVGGEIEFCFPKGTYSLFFRVHLGRVSRWLGRRSFTSEHIHGWNKKPVKFQLTTSDDQHAISQCYIDSPGNWVHYHVGDFTVGNSDLLAKVKFSMIQIDCTHTKGGLCVDSVLICPKGFRQEKDPWTYK
ncbi:putative phloem protein [Dioscorea sansibarensis]